jgi:hypothetical protein
LTTISWSAKSRTLISFNQKIVSIKGKKRKTRRSGNTLGGSKDVA